MRTSLPSTLLYLLVALLPAVAADPASIPFTDCFDEPESIDQKLNVNTVYAQVLQNADLGRYLNLTVIGTSPRDILGLANTSTSLSTLFTSTSVLTLSAWSNSSYLCQNMRPPSPLPLPNPEDKSFCPVVAGPFAFSSTIPWGRNRELTTLITRLRAVDPFGKELVCLDMLTTPLEPRPSSPYGKAEIIFWSTVALALAYWVVIGIARIASAWGRGLTRPGPTIWSRAQSAGFILASAVSGERLATSPALMRFCTPSMRDVIFHTQWCAVLAMVAVEWPQFVYPLLTQTAWSTLSYNISLTTSSQPHHWNPLTSPVFSPPDGFSSQFNDPTSPLFIDPTVANVLFTLPTDATPGISSFAYTLGIRPQDLFPTCIILFLSIIAATILISTLVWFVDHVACLIGDAVGTGHSHNPSANRLGRVRSPVFGASKELGDHPAMGALGEESTALTGPGTSTSARFPNTRFSLPLTNGAVLSERGINSHRSWWRLRSDIGAFHGSVLHGNLVRILVLFHLPVTVFSCYQMTSPRSVTSTSSIVLAALSFVVFSLLIPAHLVIRVTFTTTNKLYDETRTLLSLGPLYNHYRHGSQLFASLFFATNIAFGITVGAGQKSGTAQAIIILVVEVVSALVTSIWLPWGSGASMGLISFLFCVARIVIAVLLVILTQTISIGAGPGGWVAYGILIILALVYLALFLMLLVKIVEGLIRFFGGIGFDRSRHVVDSGLLGACGFLGCCGSRKRRRSQKRSRNSKTHEVQPSMVATRDSDLSSYMPPTGGAVPHDGTATPPRFLNSDSRKGSNGSQPPSVLKPEQANRPYKEELLDNDDEGYIMGAWQPFPRPGYTPVSDGVQTSAPGTFVLQPPHKQNPSSSSSAGSTVTPGFSRVGGGRAHIDTPYAIKTGSTQTFPSIGPQSQVTPSGNHSNSALAGQPMYHEQAMEDDGDDAPLNFSNVEAETSVGSNALPPGAMKPAHIRTKSQTAIVEDYMPVVSASGGSLGRQYQQQQQPPSLRQKHRSQDAFMRPLEGVMPPSSKFSLGGGAEPDDDESGDEQDQQKKKKPWYHLRRNRPHSSEGRTSTAASSADLRGGAVDEEMGGLPVSGAMASPQRSFVVIRKPPGSMGRLNQALLGEGGSTSANGSMSASAAGGGTYPKASSRPPTR
ncbi:hypothetical protein B0H34DRAFT_690241 [Crassisporium funariophilum]|nr:hypothetical protein B0H34DRAFT_690241 [Crassisporium funariophilum]